MGVLVPRNASYVDGGTLAKPSHWVIDSVGGSRMTMANERVGQETAKKLSAYWAVCLYPSEDLACMDVVVKKRRSEGGFDVVENHPVTRVMEEPNPEQDGFEFRRLMQYRARSLGWSPAEIVRNARGDVSELWPIHPSRLKTRVIEAADGLSWRRVYDVIGSGKPHTFEEEDLFIVQNIERTPLLHIAAEAIGVGLAAQKQSARLYSEGMAKKMVAIVKEEMTPEGRAGLRERIRGDHARSPEGVRQIPIVEGDVEMVQYGIDPEDALMLESQEFTVEVLARFGRVPLSMLFSHKRAQGWSTLDASERAYYSQSLRGLAKVWIQQMQRKLLTARAKPSHVVRIPFRSLGDIQAQIKMHETYKRNGVLNADEIREDLDMNPLPDGAGKVYMVQAQMTDAADIEQDEDEPKGEVPPQLMPSNEPPNPPDPDDDEDAQAATIARLIADAANRVHVRASHSVERAQKKHADDEPAMAKWAATFTKNTRKHIAETFAPFGEDVQSAAGAVCETEIPEDLEAALIAAASGAREHAATNGATE